MIYQKLYLHNADDSGTYIMQTVWKKQRFSLRK